MYIASVKFTSLDIREVLLDQDIRIVNSLFLSALPYTKSFMSMYYCIMCKRARSLGRCKHNREATT